MSHAVFELDSRDPAIGDSDLGNNASEKGSWNHRVDAPDVLLIVNRPVIQKFLNHDEVTGFLDELIICQRPVFVVLHGGKRLIDLGDLIQNALLLDDEILLGHLTVAIEV